MSNATGRAHLHRTYAREFKQQVIRETLEPGMLVWVVARRHDINAHVIFGWRKRYREGKLVVPALGVAPSVPSTELLTVDVIDTELVQRAPELTVASGATSSIRMPLPVCEIEVEIGKRRVKFAACLPSVLKRSCRNV